MPQVKKLSVATVYGKIDAKKVLTSDRPVDLMIVYGLAVGTKSGTSNYGEWTALVGEFEAVNCETGEASQANQLFLPEIALLPLRVALERAQSVKFAIKLQARAATNSKPGGVPYEYVFENVLPPAEDDPMQALRAEVQRLALPAPVASASQGKGEKARK
jgi:hypothetical protein